VCKLPAQALLTGTNERPPESRQLRAGPVRAIFTDGDLRRVCHGDIELARRIYVAIRDLDWNTLPGEISDLNIADHGDSFAIQFTRRHTVGDLDYEWRAEIYGDQDGTIRYRMRGQALSAFPYAKIGICVHHPIVGYAGQPYRGSTPDGPVAGNLPDAIGPQVHLDDGTDLPLFEAVSDLEITHASGGTVRFGFSGDLWEMEDQRNWTDASYKSASTPAKLGYHHESGVGTHFDQQVVIRAFGFPDPDPAGGSAARPLGVSLGAPAGSVFPPIGLRCSDPRGTVTAAARAVLRAIGPHHLRVDVHLSDEQAGGELSAAAGSARELDCALELAVFLPGPDDPGVGAALSRLRSGLAATQPALARVLAFSETEESSSARTVAAVRTALAEVGVTGVPVISGTNVYFNELNRHRIPPGMADGLAWSMNPQVHAFDDMSLMENLQAQPDTVATARSFAPGAALYVTPVTFRPRFNAVAVTGQDFPEDGLPWQVDVRQPSLFAAAWTLGSIAALAGAGIDGITYYDTVGPAGVIESPDGSPDPERFFSRPDTPFPLAVALADACGLAGRQLRIVTGIDPALISAVAVTAQDGSGSALLLANLTAGIHGVRVALTGGGDSGSSFARARLRILDARTAEVAAADLAAFLASGTEVPVIEGAVTVTLNPYAVARLDVTGE
jgi:hypothetical protein